MSLAQSVAAPAEAAPQPRRGGWRWAMARLLRNPSARIGGSVLLLILFCAAFAPWVAPHDPLHVNTLGRLLPPSATNWLGTDEVGRDIASRLIFGTRYFLLICLIASTISGGFGILLGLVAGGIIAFVSLAPPILLQAVAGLGLIGAFSNAAFAAYHNPDTREAAAITFLVTASGIAFAGISGAFWGLLAGGVMMGLQKALRRERLP